MICIDLVLLPLYSLDMTFVPTAAEPGFDARIKRIYDHLYANGSVRTPIGIASEVDKLLRVASLMENGAGVFPAFSFAPEVRRAISQGQERTIQAIAAQVRECFTSVKKASNLYQGEDIDISDSDLAWCCAQLDGVIVSSATRDSFGDAVEIFRTSWAKQSSGQFFTDGHVTHLAMTLLRFDPFVGDDLIDICSGTGGFLLAGLDRIRKLATLRGLDPSGKELLAIAKRTLRGQEVDQDISDVANASLSGRLGCRETFVHSGDSLRPLRKETPLREGSHHCAASNPPFGTKITIKSHHVLSRYELAAPNGRRPTPRPPDVLLLEQNVRMLKPGTGRLAIVVPYQILSGPQTRYIRDWLLRHSHLEAVVDLPPETFQPHTGTKTSLLVVRRRLNPLDEIVFSEDGTVFMSTPKWIGHDRRGRPVFECTPDGRHTTTILSDMEDVANAFEGFCQARTPSAIHAESFAVPITAVVADADLRLNARYYRDRNAIEASVSRRRGWDTVRLGDLSERIFFPTRFKRHYVESSEAAVPFLGGANITELLVKTDKWISKSDPKLPELIVQPGWLLITRSGTTGIVSSVPAAWDGFAISEHVIRVVPKNDCEPAVLAWIQVYLRSTDGQRALKRGVFGSVIDEITPEFVADIRIPIPDDPDTRAKIASAVAVAEETRQRSISSFDEAAVVLKKALSGRHRNPPVTLKNPLDHVEQLLDSEISL